MASSNGPTPKIKSSTVEQVFHSDGRGDESYGNAELIQPYQRDPPARTKQTKGGPPPPPPPERPPRIGNTGW